jgi:hypothetical protein
MYNCEIEYANLNLNWKFPFMISQLPVPATESFNFLIKGLRPFGITPRALTLEAPSSNLDDVVLSLILLNHKFVVRLTYSGIEAEGKDIYADEVLQILQILAVVFNSLEKIDSEIKRGIGVVRLSLHLSFLEKIVDDYLSERISAKINRESATPEAVIFSLEFDELTRVIPTKITLAKSLAVENGLFLEINYQSGENEDELREKEPMAFFQMLSEHYQSLLAFLELNVIVEEE